MLSGTKTMSVLPVRDAERARRFYVEKLGLKQAGKMPDGGLLVETSASRIELMPWPDASPSRHTVLSFEVPDVETEVRDLERKGVKFEDYDLPEIRTEKHIFRKNGEVAAWFKDPEGNILCVHQS